MNSNWIPMKPSNTPQTNSNHIARRIDDLIQWYEDHSTRKEDDYIKAHLRLIADLAKNIENSEDLMFVDKIVDTFGDIVRTQRQAIQDLEDEAVCQSLAISPPHSYVSSYAMPEDGFTNDEQIKAAFFSYMIHEKKRSSFTANDYILRVQSLWRSFYSDYEAGELPSQLAESVIKEEIHPEFPLLNAYNYIEELNRYLSMQIAGASTNRNWLTVRAALNVFGEALHGDGHEKVKVPREANQSKDFSKYLVEGKPYGKSRLVLAVVQKYVEDYHPATFDELENAFPSALQGSLGVVRRIEDVSDKYKGIGGVKRYFVKEDEIIHLRSGEQVIVCTQWGASNTEAFVKYAVKELGYSIEKA